ncbi:heterokaryon incompatibility protein-domain-containing protein [Schizothecium vesticola]|uniref:Heterokaryon incompatibility protein-domain-containing protein n=1 Tax=Schizothecium vesticola TaxID=314040 RepID=A0AA40K9K5_9PEZI|nr:heterokaryon incompatibility protein-domain-containing protein [Schizothecium vesticola]
MSKMMQKISQSLAPPGAPPCPVCHNLIFTSSDLKISVAQLRNESLCPCCSLLWHLISKITSSDTVHADISYDHLLFTLSSFRDRHGTGPLYGHLLPNPLLGGTPTPGHDLQFYTHPSAPPSPYPSIGAAPRFPSTPSPPPHSPSSAPGSHPAPPPPAGTPPAPHPPYHPPPHPPHRRPPHPSPPLPPPPGPSTASYAALSHCWANRPTTRTLTSTLAAHLVALPHPLPQTFADAVAVTRALDIPYLWIDSLCIVQDDRADWAREASLMGDVYANALVTVAADAAAAGGAEGGFLAPGVRRVGREVGGPAAGGATVVASPRTLRTTSVVKRFLLDAALGEAGATWRREVVPAYTRLDLTVATDRLPALEGLARAMGELRGGGRVYLWGLWRASLGRDLLWRTETEVNERRRVGFLPEGYAPTWSWGSVVGQVMYDGVDEDDEVVGFKVVDVGDGDDGRLTVLKGRGCAVDLTLKDDRLGPARHRP